MTHETAVRLTAEIVVDTIAFLAEKHGVDAAVVIEAMGVPSHPLRRQMSELLALATDYVGAN